MGDLTMQLHPNAESPAGYVNVLLELKTIVNDTTTIKILENGQMRKSRCLDQ